MKLKFLSFPFLVLFPFLTVQGNPISDEEVAKRIGDLFEKVMLNSGPPRAPFLRRPVFAKAHGCVKAKFTVNPALPKKYRVGPFEKSYYPAWIRFSNDGGFGPDTRKSARGMAIKLVGVAEGDRILDGDEKSVTQDFVMQNHPIFFVDTARDFLDFTEAVLSPDPQLKKDFDKAHPETERIFTEMDKNLLADPLDGTYWTPTPYRLGKRYVMKYRAKPCHEVPNPPTKKMEGDHFLRENLKSHLAEEADACMEFHIQPRRDAGPGVVDRATTLWDPETVPFILAATLSIPKGQNVDDPEREALCESLSMTGWHGTSTTLPVGSINEARKVIYKRMAEVRRKKNRVSLEEPTQIKDLPEAF